MSIAEHARREALATHPLGDAEAYALACEKAAVPISLANLSSFAFVREAVLAGRLRLHGWYFDLGRGEPLGWDRDNGRFCVLLPGRVRPAERECAWAAHAPVGSTNIVVRTSERRDVTSGQTSRGGPVRRETSACKTLTIWCRPVGHRE